MAETRKRGIRATPKGIMRLQKAQAEFKNEAQAEFKNVRPTYEKISEQLRISDKTVARFFRGEKVDKVYAIKIIEFFKLPIEDIISSEEFLVEESITRIEDENSERAQELIEKLHMALDDLKREEDISHQAMDWLKANQKVLVQEAVKATLKSPIGQKYFGANPKDSELEQFSQDIRKYLQLIYYSLEEGSWAVIDGAIQESLVPANQEIELYTKALTFIKDQEVNQKLSSEVAQPITVFLDYLINVLPMRF